MFFSTVFFFNFQAAERETICKATLSLRRWSRYNLSAGFSLLKVKGDALQQICNLPYVAGMVCSAKQEGIIVALKFKGFDRKFKVF